MRVLLANPPVLQSERKFNRPIRFPAFSYATEVIHPPLLLAYAAAFIRSKGHEVNLIDASALALSTSAFIDRVKKFQPDYVAFETSTASFKNDAAVAKMVKETTGCKTVFLGTHVSALPQKSLESSDLDAAVMGEYEYPLLEYIEKGPKDARGIAYRAADGKIVVNQRMPYNTDLDSLPFPARDLIPNYSYFDPILKNPFTFVLSGRGCPYRCTFCNWPQTLWGHEYRLRSSKNVCNELEHIKADYNFKSFLFNDDTFTVNKSHAMAVANEIVKRGIDIPWACYSRPDLADGSVLQSLRRAGCFLLKVGVENGSQTILNNIKKGTTVENIRRGIMLMKEYGFDVHATFVFGMPGETEETIRQTIEFAKELEPTTVQFSTAVPYPETEFYKYLKDQGYLITTDWERFMPLQPIYRYPNITGIMLQGAVRQAYKSYYFRAKYFKIGLVGLFTEPRRFLHNFFSLLRFVF
jgi:radical SAM superfamily enzyme YgiQ (UPF0313 family)